MKGNQSVVQLQEQLRSILKWSILANLKWRRVVSSIKVKSLMSVSFYVALLLLLILLALPIQRTYYIYSLMSFLWSFFLIMYSSNDSLISTVLLVFDMQLICVIATNMAKIRAAMKMTLGVFKMRRQMEKRFCSRNISVLPYLTYNYNIVGICNGYLIHASSSSLLPTFYLYFFERMIGRWSRYKLANQNILLQMQLKGVLLLLLAITVSESIGLYDFNACRISNCNAEQLNCLSDESGCLNYFAIMRNCFATCGDSKNWNSCWSSCKNSAARSNSYYLSLSLCYENLCYLWEKYVVGLLTIPIMMMILI